MMNLRSPLIRYPWLAWVVLAAGLCAAVATFLLVRQEKEGEVRAAFAAQADDITDNIMLRVRAYNDVLYALRGLFHSSSEVTREEFRRFITGLAIHDRFPGLLNVSYAQYVPQAGKAEFERRVRRETGFGHFTINPPGDRPEYHVLIFFEPQEGRRPPFGLDLLAADPPRRAIVERARDNGETATSEPVTLPRDKSGREVSVLLRLAIYHGGIAPPDLAGRRRDYEGVVSTTINIREMLHATLGKGQLRRARLLIYDQGPESPGTTSRPRGTLLFDSYDLLRDARKAQDAPDYSRFAIVRSIGVGDRAWQLHVVPRVNPAGLEYRIMPFAAALAVATISLLLFGLIKALAAAESRAMHDKLTGLYNRHYMQEWLDLELRRAARYGRPMSAVLCDIDYFKNINDTYGHEAGDVVLQEFAALLKRSARDSDVACRYGGEEFLLLMPESLPQAACQRADQLREALRNTRIFHRGRPLGPVTISAGVASFPEHGGDREILLRMADFALYRAKQSGRDRVMLAQAQPAGGTV